MGTRGYKLIQYRGGLSAEVETDEPYSVSIGSYSEQVSERHPDFSELIRGVCDPLIETLKDIGDDVSEIEMEVNVSLGAEGNVFLSKRRDESHVKITLRLNKEKLS